MPSSTVGIGRRNFKHLNLCFSNFKRPESQSPPTTPTPTTSTTSSLQHVIDHNRSSPTGATTSIMIKNFNTLYDHALTFEHYSLCSSSLSTSFEPEPEPEPEPADFATAFASQRFFFSSPGRSNSIIESINTDTTDCTSCSSSSLMATALPPEEGEATTADDNKKKQVFMGSVAVPTYSPDPYLDFRRSMQEMVQAHPELMDVKANWDVLHELLLCYLALNPKATHKFILGAFSDLLVSLMSFSSSCSSKPPPEPEPNSDAAAAATCDECKNLDIN